MSTVHGTSHCGMEIDRIGALDSGKELPKQRDLSGRQHVDAPRALRSQLHLARMWTGDDWESGG